MKKAHLSFRSCELRPVRPDIRLTSAGSLDPVTSSIPHHSPDWISPAWLLNLKGEAVGLQDPATRQLTNDQTEPALTSVSYLGYT